MKRAGMALLLLVAVAAIGAACGRGNGSGSGDGGNNGTARTAKTATTSTATAATISTPTTGSSSNFAQLRDALRNRLNGIGVNIGSVPDDVLTQVLNQCHDLGRLADQNRVNDLCAAIKRARDTNDIGLIDQIVTQLGQLQPK